MGANKYQEPVHQVMGAQSQALMEIPLVVVPEEVPDQLIIKTLPQPAAAAVALILKLLSA